MAAVSLQPAYGDDTIHEKTVVSGKQVIVGGGARFNKECEAGPPPIITLGKAPEHGVACVRIAEITPQKFIDGQLKGTLFGTATHCVNRAIKGVNLVYESFPGFTGEDTLTFTLHYPRRESTYAEHITVLPDGAKSVPTALPSPEKQHAGPVPECAALAS